MTLVLILAALVVGIVIGATESQRVINELHKVAGQLHDEIKGTANGEADK